jgi:hypothetical protein
VGGAIYFAVRVCGVKTKQRKRRGGMAEKPAVLSVVDITLFSPWYMSAETTRDNVRSSFGYCL